MSSKTQGRAAIWMRVSTVDQNLENQRSVLHELADQLGVTPVREFEVKASASGHGTKFEAERAELVAGAERGDYDTVIIWAIDRLSRLGINDTLMTVAKLGAVVTVVSRQDGELDPDDDNSELTTAIKAWMAKRESTHKGKRVAAARKRQALSGQYGGGQHRPFGYERDGVSVRQSEADVIADATAKVAAGRSLRSLAAGLRGQGVVSSTGKPFTPNSLRDVLLRPRNIGQAVYQGEPVGQPGEAGWPAVVDTETWRNAVAVLTNPARRHGKGNTAKWLGSCIYRCGKCGGIMTHRESIYACRRCGCAKISQAETDALVTEVITRRLARPDAAALIEPEGGGTGGRAVALRHELTQLAGREADIAESYASGALGQAAYRKGLALIGQRRGQVQAELDSLASQSVLAPVAGRADAAAVWQQMHLEDQRAILRELAEVTIRPSELRGGRPAWWKPGMSCFDRTRLVIAWRREAESLAA